MKNYIMGRFDTTKLMINANVKTNGKQEITGQVMNNVLTQMVEATDSQLTELESGTSEYAPKITIQSEGLEVTGRAVFPVKKGHTYRIVLIANNLTYIGAAAAEYMIQLGTRTGVFVSLNKDKQKQFVENTYIFNATQTEYILANYRIANGESFDVYVKDITSFSLQDIEFYQGLSANGTIHQRLQIGGNGLSQSHSSNWDRIPCYIPKGSVVSVVLNNSGGGNHSFSLYLFDKDGTSHAYGYGELRTNQYNEIVTTEDAYSVGLYIDGIIGQLIDFSLIFNNGFDESYTMMKNCLPYDNLLDNSLFVCGYLKENGQFTKASTDIYLSGFIPCHGEDYISTTYGGRDTAYVAFYDEKRRFISALPSTQKIFAIPKNAYYVRLASSYYSQDTAIFGYHETIKSVPYGGNSAWVDQYVQEMKTAIDLSKPISESKSGHTGEWVTWAFDIDASLKRKYRLEVYGDATPALVGGQASWYQIFIKDTTGQRINIRNYEPILGDPVVMLKEEKIDLTSYDLTKVEVSMRFHENEMVQVSLCPAYVFSFDGGGDSISHLNKESEKYISAACNRFPSEYTLNNRGLFSLFAIQSDIHDDYTRMERGFQYAEDTQSILATLVLGDIFDNSNKAFAYNWTSAIMQYEKPILPIIGNHEVLSIEPVGIKGMTDSEIMDKFYSEELIEHSGAVHSNDRPYWYRDFPQGNKVIRVIGLYQYELQMSYNSNGYPEYGQNSGKGKDTIYYTQEQMNWLVGILNSCDENTYVMILTHFAPSKNNMYAENTWNPSMEFGYRFDGGDGLDGQTNYDMIPTIVQAWIDGASVQVESIMKPNNSKVVVKTSFTHAHDKRFIGYVSGHIHRDAIGTLKDFPKQRQISVTCTTNEDAQQANDNVRGAGKVQDSITLIGYDYINDIVNLVRIGADITLDGRDRKFTKL